MNMINSDISFSIVLPAYNTPPDVLRRAIRSVLNQTYPYFEFIIVDDGSQPSLESIVKEFEDERILFIRHAQNKGAGAAHNTGIKAANYEWIAFICHDDEWLPEKLERQKNTIIQHKDREDLALVYCDVNFIHTNPLESKYYTFKYFSINDNPYLLCLTKVYFYTSTIIVRKKALVDIGLYDETGVLIDWDLYIRLSLKYKFQCLNEKLVNYFFSPMGITHHKNTLNSSIAGNDLFKMYYKWKKEIFSYFSVRKVWAIRWNAIAKMYIEKKQTKDALIAYLESIKLNPFWRGNYIDIIKYFILKMRL